MARKKYHIFANPQTMLNLLWALHIPDAPTYTVIELEEQEIKAALQTINRFCREQPIITPIQDDDHVADHP